MSIIHMKSPIGRELNKIIENNDEVKCEIVSCSEQLDEQCKQVANSVLDEYIFNMNDRMVTNGKRELEKEKGTVRVKQN